MTGLLTRNCQYSCMYCVRSCSSDTVWDLLFLRYTVRFAVPAIHCEIYGFYDSL